MKSPKELGTEAYHAGARRSENPYERDTLSFHNWNAAFDGEAESAWSDIPWYFDEKMQVRNLAFYIEKAKEEIGATSDRELSIHLGLAPNAVHGWQEKNVIPSDTSLIKLAVLAKEPPQKAVLELNIWRNEGATRETYETLFQMLKKNLMVTVATVLFGALSFNSNAISSPLMSPVKAASVYYGN